MESRKSLKHKPFINKFNREKINYPSKIDDWKKVEKNNPTIAPKEQKILPAYISNHNPTREKTIILLMIPNKEKEGCHYLAVKKIFTLLREITSKHNGDFYCFNCLHTFRTENKLKSHEKLCKNKVFVEF